MKLKLRLSLAIYTTLDTKVAEDKDRFNNHMGTKTYFKHNLGQKC